MLDLKIPGLNLRGATPDHFRVSAEVIGRAAVDAMRAMVKDLALKGEFDLLRARVERRITTIQLYQAYRGTNGDLVSLKNKLTTRDRLLGPFVDEWVKQLRTRDCQKTEFQVRRFVTWLDAAYEAASVDHLDDDIINTFLASLTSLRGTSRPPANPQTRDRYRAAIGGFCSYLFRRGIITVHPIKHGEVPLWSRNPDKRLPRASRKEYEAYFRGVSLMRPDLPSDLAVPLREACTVFLRLLWHTGGDVGELRRLIVDDITWPEGSKYADENVRSLATIRLKRTKVKSPEREVPYPPKYAEELRRFVETRHLKFNDLVFGSLRQVIGLKGSYLPDVRVAHEMGVKEMGRAIRIKDLRHLAAISWAKADVRIELIKEWLGHATLNQTMIYSRFIPTHGEIFHKITSAAQLGRANDEP